MKRKTLTGIRVDSNPMFVSIASSAKANTALVAYNDKAEGIFFVAQASEKDVYSPFNGKTVEALSIGEVAATDDFFTKSLKKIGTCKCGCEVATTQAVSELLKANDEKTIHCTACGEKVELADEEVVEDEDSESEEEVVDDENVDDDSEGDEDSESEDEEEVVEDDEGVDDSEDSEDDEEIDEEVQALLKEAAEAEDDGDIEAEVAALIAEIASEEDDESEDESVDDEEVIDEDSDEDVEMSSTRITHPLHKLVDFKAGKVGVLFVNTDVAMLQRTSAEGIVHIGTFYREHAKPESAKLYDKRDMFGQIVAKVIEQGALESVDPAAAITDLGFKPIKVELPLSVAQETEVKKAVTEAENKAAETASAKLTDVSGNYSKLVTIAALGLDKGAIAGNVSLYNELIALLESAGVRQADLVARKFCETKLKPFFGGVIEKANELAAKDPAYVAALADTVAVAKYVAPDKDISDISTAVHDKGADVTVASLDEERNRRVPRTNLQDTLRSLGRRSRFQ